MIARTEPQGPAEPPAPAFSVPDEIVDAVSHELRTPLTSILGMSRLIEREPTASGLVADAAREVYREAKRLHRFVEDLLSLARDDGTEMIDRLEPQRLDRLALHAIESHRQRYPDRRLALVATGQTLVIGHSAWIERVLTYFLEHAEERSAGGLSIE